MFFYILCQTTYLCFDEY